MELQPLSPLSGRTEGNSVSKDETDSENQWPLSDSLNSMIQMYKIFGGSVRSNEILSFIENFVSTVVREAMGGGGQNYLISSEIFACPVCYGIWTEPVTIHCGHSYCRKCLDKLRPRESCRKCEYKITDDDISMTKLDLLMASLITRLWPTSIEASVLREEGNRLFQHEKYEQSLNKYAKTISLRPEDHMAWANRSHLHLTMGKAEAALQDAETVIRLCSAWPKGYYRKAAVLIQLENYEEAFLSLVLCSCILKCSRVSEVSEMKCVKNELLTVGHRMFLHNFLTPTGDNFVELQNQKQLVLEWKVGAGNPLGGFLNNEGNRRAGRNDKHHNHNSTSSPHFSEMTFSSQQNSEQLQKKLRRFFDRTKESLIDVRQEAVKFREKLFNSGIRINSVKAESNSETEISLDDFECTLCFRLFHEPIVTSCGHLFCRPCLERALDHSLTCPLCKTCLQTWSAHRRFCVAEFVDAVISHYLPAEKAARRQQHTEEIAIAFRATNGEGVELPIFVCTVTFPGLPCPLHVFQPKYRLMVRRVMETGVKAIGICCSLFGDDNVYSECGTVVEVVDMQYFPDGRSVIRTMGIRRFKIIKKHRLDGYDVATIEYLVDCPIAEEEREGVVRAHDALHSSASEWINSLNPVMKQRIGAHYGELPDPERNWIEKPDGPHWMWWLLTILPLEPKPLMTILSMASLKKRLEAMANVLAYIRNVNA